MTKVQSSSPGGRMDQGGRIQELVAQRARAQREMQQAEAELGRLGVSAKDGPQGTSWAMTRPVAALFCAAEAEPEPDAEVSMQNCYIAVRAGDQITFPLVSMGRMDSYVVVPKEQLLSLARDVESGAVKLGSEAKPSMTKSRGH